jgi:ABC transporter substrate binding protein
LLAGDRMQFDQLKRRKFITLLGGAAAAWPLAARAQQSERMRRIGMLLPATPDDAQYQAWVGAFVQGLAQSGWSINRNVSIDTRWATAKADAIRTHAAELVALTPDVILAPGASTVRPLLQVTRTVPIVFAIVGDPVGAGFVESLARPGGNVTGFMAFEYPWREVAGAAQGDCARRDESGRPSRSYHNVWHSPVRRYPDHGTFAQGRGKSCQRARCRRYPASRPGICAILEWRPDRDGEPANDLSTTSAPSSPSAG